MKMSMKDAVGLVMLLAVSGQGFAWAHANATAVRPRTPTIPHHIPTPMVAAPRTPTGRAPPERPPMALLTAMPPAPGRPRRPTPTVRVPLTRPVTGPRRPTPTGTPPITPRVVRTRLTPPRPARRRITALTTAARPFIRPITRPPPLTTTAPAATTAGAGTPRARQPRVQPLGWWPVRPLPTPTTRRHKPTPTMPASWPVPRPPAHCRYRALPSRWARSMRCCLPAPASSTRTAQPTTSAATTGSCPRTAPTACTTAWFRRRIEWRPPGKLAREGAEARRANCRATPRRSSCSCRRSGRMPRH